MDNAVSMLDPDPRFDTAASTACAADWFDDSVLSAAFLALPLLQALSATTAPIPPIINLESLINPNGTPPV
jgi:hypothetical protein